MTTSFDTPRTLNGIKHSANQLARVHDLSRTQSLNRAAQFAGLANWNNARRVLPESMPLACIEASWIDKENGTRGVETLTYPLKRPIGEMLSVRKTGPRFAMFLLIHDHLVSSQIATSQTMARGFAVEALRALMFMEATGLIPVSKLGAAYPRRRETYRGTTFYDLIEIPGEDHVSAWYDRETKGYVIVDEPYLSQSEHKDQVARAAWCNEHGYIMAIPNWRGMYNPEGGARIHLFTRDTSKINLSGLVERVNLLPDDFGSEQWKGVSIVEEYLGDRVGGVLYPAHKHTQAIGFRAERMEIYQHMTEQEQSAFKDWAITPAGAGRVFTDWSGWPDVYKRIGLT